VISVALFQTIQEWHDGGVEKREIARRLKVDVKTVRRIIRKIEAGASPRPGHLQARNLIRMLSGSLSWRQAAGPLGTFILLYGVNPTFVSQPPSGHSCRERQASGHVEHVAAVRIDVSPDEGCQRPSVDGGQPVAPVRLPQDLLRISVLM